MNKKTIKDEFISTIQLVEDVREEINKEMTIKKFSFSEINNLIFRSKTSTYEPLLQLLENYIAFHNNNYTEEMLRRMNIQRPSRSGSCRVGLISLKDYEIAYDILFKKVKTCSKYKQEKEFIKEIEKLKNNRLLEVYDLMINIFDKDSNESFPLQQLDKYAKKKKIVLFKKDKKLFFNFSIKNEKNYVFVLLYEIEKKNIIIFSQCRIKDTYRNFSMDIERNSMINKIKKSPINNILNNMSIEEIIKNEGIFIRD